MTVRWITSALTMVGIICPMTGCTRAELYSITEGESTDAGTETSSDLCPASTLKPGDTSRTIHVGALTRSYVLHVPETYDSNRPSPLIIDFHGIGGTGWGQLASSPYPAVTHADGVILAFPNGMTGPIGSGWNMGPCCVAEVDDLGFAHALVEDVKGVTCVDSKRIYAVGVLTGGGMAQHLACRAADVFAAIAPAAFDLLGETADDCQPSRPISVISFRGTGDTHVPYAGGPSSLVPGMPITFLGAQASSKKWAQINGCSGEPSAEDSNGCTTYGGCNAEADVILCTKQGGKEEPGDASIAWPFLSSHALP